MGLGTGMSRNLFNIVPGAFVTLVLDKGNEDCSFFECMSFAHAHESTRKIICPTLTAPKSHAFFYPTSDVILVSVRVRANFQFPQFQ